jgi:MFS family permease
VVPADADDGGRGERPSVFAYPAAGAVLFLALFGNNAPTPLYPVWQMVYGFSAGATSAIHSSYPLGVMAGLLVGGKVADQIGRRPVLFVALGIGIASSILMIVSSTVSLLLAARLLNGIAIGLLSGPVVAAMVELHPQSSHAVASRMSSILTTVSAALGLLAATIIVDLLQDRWLGLVAPFAMQFATLACAFVLVFAFPETLPTKARRRWMAVDYRPSAVAIPREIVLDFTFAAGAAFVAWAVVGFWLALAPTLVNLSLGTGYMAHGGIAAAAVLAVAGAVQLPATRMRDSVALVAGLSVEVLSLGALQAFTMWPSLTLLYAAAVAAGVGQGLCWMGSARLVNRVCPPSGRAGAVSALFIAVYAGVFAILAVGLVADRFGMTAGVTTFVAATALLAALTLVAGRRVGG